MRHWLMRLLVRWYRALRPQPTPQELDLTAQNHWLSQELDASMRDNNRRGVEYLESVVELIEARQMAGVGPWLASAAVLADTDDKISHAIESYKNIKVKENQPITAIGAYGDIELALQNVEWRREVNLSWLEFSRWGIQQIILISRLHYIKHPWLKRGINLAAYYVFGRGVEISSPDEGANDVLTEFFERNRKTLGQVGLASLEKRLHYDGQVFFVLFPDTESTGKVNCRTIDATEIQDIITDPDDTDTPWYYKRIWTERIANPVDGTVATSAREAWYPALNYTAPSIKDAFGAAHNDAILWNSPVYHMRAGTGVSKWHFDVPIVYAALDWAKAGRKFLEACLTTMQSLAQISMTMSTKGGQQAIEGIKQQLGTTVNAAPGNSLWDTNPTAVNASIFASGPGTKLEAFKARDMGANPADVKEYRNMVGIVLDIPPTWLGDLETSNLATAQTLDRPTELGFLEKQERWRETLVILSQYVLGVSKGAPSGALRESIGKRADWTVGDVRVIEAKRRYLASGRWVYESDKTPKANEIQIRVTFPSIREGDIPALIGAVVAAMTLGNRGGQIVGIDEKAGVKKLFELAGIEEADELMEEMYPDKEYEPDRTQQELTAPIPKLQPRPGGTVEDPNTLEPGRKVTPAVERAIRRLARAFKVYEAANPESSNGVEHTHRS